MTTMTSPPQERMSDFESLPVVSRVEGDRFCDSCGYNLNTQAVRRDPTTGVLLCRCPECGTFHAAGDMTTAGRLWLYRAGRILLVTWVFTAWSAAVGVMMVQVAVTLSMVDLLRPMLISNNPETHPLARVWTQIIGSACALSVVLGFATVSVCAMVFTHWKRWSYAIAAALWPIISAILIWFYFAYVNWTMQGMAPVFFRVGLIPVTAYLLGGVVGVMLGRRFARLQVRWLVPPTLWGSFSYLWTTDGLTPPTPHKPRHP
ncbi:MAG: hypothetical protein K8S99_13220 [Planctomycetes bacterium]|nr:hypothetical protein [Planctomycetota bacterium]